MNRRLRSRLRQPGLLFGVEKRLPVSAHALMSHVRSAAGSHSSYKYSSSQPAAGLSLNIRPVIFHEEARRATRYLLSSYPSSPG